MQQHTHVVLRSSTGCACGCAWPCRPSPLHQVGGAGTDVEENDAVEDEDKRVPKGKEFTALCEHNRARFDQGNYPPGHE